MGKVVINEEGCKGCAYCVLVCPRALIVVDQDRINDLGYNPAVFQNNREKGCTGCALCAEICPEVLIEVYREKRKTGETL